MNTAGKIRVGIAGSAGYTGGELIRLLLLHPHAEIVFAHSKSNAGKFLYEVHADLRGETNLQFSGTMREDVDVLFLCLGHGESKQFLDENKISPHTRLIDLSQDFRLPSSTAQSHGFVYGLPELNKDKIKSAVKVANPGCFATCIQLALLPLAAQRLLKTDVHVSATTGSTGAGQALSPTIHFSWRHSNLSAYKTFTHQHLPEIIHSLRQLQPDYSAELNFIPHRGSFTRGIFATAYTEVDRPFTEIRKMYADFYAGSPFVFLSDTPVDLKQVINTNKCFLYLEQHGSRLLIISIIDNLLKGASGQAVQNMNLMCGLEETCGLKLKAVAF
ncbi:MAG: N-acetyl-gamma-glutamyl-phosphate reductase [Chitinophagales bacterium]|nr:MAG: N-acetyl-gamma-glutamyl-phosphate reductase [Chitinophagales bacterium]